MHQSVLLTEVVEQLNIRPDGRYVDGTLGMGGHAEAILRRLGPRGRLLGLDVDPDALKRAESRLQPFEDQTITRQVNFRGLQGVLQSLGWSDVDGMVFDLGVSSEQLSEAARGFSFQSEGPLDMRLGADQKLTALDFLKGTDEKTLSEAFSAFGEKRQSRKISRYLLHDIRSERIKTTRDLARFCERVVGRRGQTHPATRIFLALRVLVNDELASLNDLLTIAPPLLSSGGRLAVISFHSFEDRLTKKRFSELSLSELGNHSYRITTKKPIRPSVEEIRSNPRARSAKLRVLERIS